MACKIKNAAFFSSIYGGQKSRLGHRKNHVFGKAQPITSKEGI